MPAGTPCRGAGETTCACPELLENPISGGGEDILPVMNTDTQITETGQARETPKPQQIPGRFSDRQSPSYKLLGRNQPVKGDRQEKKFLSRHASFPYTKSHTAASWQLRQELVDLTPAHQRRLAEYLIKQATMACCCANHGQPGIVATNSSTPVSTLLLS